MKRRPMRDDTDAGTPQLVESLSNVQIEQLHALYQLEWWSRGRALEDVRQLMQTSSLVFGLIDGETGRLVAFCRILTDFLYHATLYDVIVAADCRGRGLGSRLLDAVVDHPRLQRVQAMWLCCLPELLPFYASWGFTLAEHEIKWLRRTTSESALPHG